MTKTRIGAFAALTLAAATLVSPALASAAPAAKDDFESHLLALSNMGEGGTFEFKCDQSGGSEYRYLVFDNGSPGPITYFTGDGQPIGDYVGDAQPWAITNDGLVWSPVVGSYFTLSSQHKDITVYCAKTPEAAHQRV